MKATITPRQRLCRIMCWMPVIGIPFEFVYVLVWNEGYLSDDDHTARYIFSLVWHAGLTLLFSVSALFFCLK